MTNGSAQRKSPSWIENFVEWSANHEAPEIFRRWAAITTVGAALEQRVFVTTSRQLFPNLYTMLVGPPGVGKSIAISAAASVARTITDLNVGPISLTGASLVDAVAAARRVISEHGRIEPLLFNSLYLMPDDLQALLHKYDNELVANLTIFYDTNPYIQTRRVGSLHIEINSPQLSILAGTTNSHLLNLLPPGAWEQGFMSRTIMVHASDRRIQDDIFTQVPKSADKDLLHDLRCIFALKGQLAVSDSFRSAFNDWRGKGMVPAPSHPRLQYYCSRRVAHLLKLASISSADRGDSLNLDMYDFVRARQWLEGAESTMPDVFAGPATVDARAMQEIVHLIGSAEISEQKLTRLAADRVSANAVKRTIELMIESGMIQATIKAGLKGRYFRVCSEE